jgi:hypothetical protein
MEIVEEIGHEQKRFVIRKRKDDKMPVIDLWLIDNKARLIRTQIYNWGHWTTYPCIGPARTRCRVHFYKISLD